MKPLPIAHRVYVVLIALLTLFIWAQSLLSANQSLDQSDAVGGWLAALLGDGRIATFLVENIRKVAHFMEFGLLGILWSSFAHARQPRPGSWPLVPGVLTATIDELIQLGSAGRSAQLTDVLLDCAGYATGWLGIAIIVWLWQFCGKKNRKNTCNFDEPMIQ